VLPATAAGGGSSRSANRGMMRPSVSYSPAQPFMAGVESQFYGRVRTIEYNILNRGHCLRMPQAVAATTERPTCLRLGLLSVNEPVAGGGWSRQGSPV